MILASSALLLSRTKVGSSSRTGPSFLSGGSEEGEAPAHLSSRHPYRGAPRIDSPNSDYTGIKRARCLAMAQQLSFYKISFSNKALTHPAEGGRDGRTLWRFNGSAKDPSSHQLSCDRPDQTNGFACRRKRHAR